MTGGSSAPAGDTAATAPDRALFSMEAGRFVPTSMTTGPWRTDAMHGGAPGALIATLVAREVEGPEEVTSVAIDLERPVPLEPLAGVVRRRRTSRRVAHLDVELLAETGRVAAGRAVLVTREPDIAAPAAVGHPGGPDGLEPMNWDHLYPPGMPSFVRDAVEHRMVHGGYGAQEASGAWLRLLGPVVENQAPHPLAQLLAVADFGSPLSQTGVLGPGLALINIDVNVSLFRAPAGPWFYLDAVGYVGHGGIGLATTRLADRQGALGVITQTQLAHRYERPPGATRPGQT